MAMAMHASAIVVGSSLILGILILLGGMHVYEAGSLQLRFARGGIDRAPEHYPHK